MAQARPTRLSADNPWPGLESFGEDDSSFFHGRSSETAELLRMIRRGPVILLYGRSGLGKTSLLNAGLFPVLRERGFVPVSIRIDFTGDGPAPRVQILDRLLSECQERRIEAPERIDSETLWEYFHRKDADFWTEKNRLITPVLVLDQFEEAFIRGQEDSAAVARRREFFTELGDLIEGRAPSHLKEVMDERPEVAERYDFTKTGFVVILSLREDFLPEVEGLKLEMPSLTHNRYRLQPMDGRQAAEVVLTNGGHLVNADVAARIIGFAAGRDRAPEPEEYAALEIDPALLSLICSELNARRLRADQSKITEDLLSGAEHEILSDFYERSMVGLDPRLRAFVEDELLTGKGYRDSYALDDALALPGITRKAIDALVARRLVRLDERFGVRRLELTHDVLTRVVRESRDSRQLREAQLAAEARERLQKRRLRIVVGAAGLMFVLMVTFAWLLWESTQARRAEERQARAVLSQRLAAASRALLPTRGDLGLLLALEANRISDTAEAKDLMLSLETLIDPRLQQYLSLEDGAAGALAFSPDGKLLATANLKTIVVWDLATGQPIGDLVGHKDVVTSVAFSPDGRLIASAAKNGSIVLWDVARRKPAGPPLVDHEGSVLCLAFSPDGTVLLSGGADNAVIAWDVATRKALKPPLAGHSDAVTGVAFRPDGGMFVSTSRDATLILWDRAALRPISAPLDQSSAITTVAFSRDGKTIAAGDESGTIVLWDVEARKRRGAGLNGHREAVTNLAFGAGGRLASGGADGSTRLWDLSNGTPTSESATGLEDPVTGLAFSADGKVLAQAGGDVVSISDLSPHPTNRARLEGHAVSVTHIVFSADGSTLASADESGRVQLWEMSRRQPRTTLHPVGKEQPLGLGRDARGLLLAARDAGGELRLRRLDPATDSPLPMGVWKGGAPLIQFSADGSVVAARDNRRVALYDTTAGTPLGQDIDNPSGMGVALRRDGKVVALATAESTVVLLDRLTHQRLTECDAGQLAHVSPLTFSPDGHRLAIVGEDPQIPDTWSVVHCDPATGRSVEPRLRLKDLNDLVFSPDGKLIATASTSRPFVALWNAATGAPLGELFLSERYNRDNTMSALAFSPDGNMLAVANNTVVLLADLDFDAKIARMCRIANRNLTREEWQKYIGDRPYHMTCPRAPGAVGREQARQ